MKAVRVVLLAMLLPWLELRPWAAEPVLPLRTNDVIAFIGGANMVALAQSGHLETLLTLHHPRHKLRFRSLAWEVGLRSGNPLAATFQDFDWADEVLHARVGRDWYVNNMPGAHAAVDYGDRCWSKVLANWSGWREAGLTQHANWWPAAYGQFCERNGVVPVPSALNYAISYESVRADLKDLSASG
jgi:hypothetical protein